MWPSSRFGTRTPSTNSAEPMPVPSVRTRTVPRTPRPAPKRISATAAASASLSTVTGRPIAAVKSSGAGSPTHDASRLAIISTRPPTIGPGTPTPTGPCVGPSDATSAAAAATTADGVAGWGVGTRTRSPIRTPRRESTTPALIPDPPMSTPMRPLMPRPPRSRS